MESKFISKKLVPFLENNSQLFEGTISTERTDSIKKKLKDVFSESELKEISNIPTNDFRKKLGDSEKNQGKNQKLLGHLGILKAVIKVISDEQNGEEKNNEEEKRNQELTEQEQLYTSFFEDKLGLSASDIRIEEGKIEISIKITKTLQSRLDDFGNWNYNDDNLKNSLNEKFCIPQEKIIIIENLSDYFKFIDDKISSESVEDYVSRGQKDCSFDFLPTLFRVAKSKQGNKENQLVNLFKMKGIFYDSSLSDKSMESVIAYGQHFGLPTRFLDFTEAHLLSLFFAVEEYKYQNNCSVVYFVNSKSVNKRTVKEEVKTIDLSNQTTNERMKTTFSDSIYFAKLEDSNKRIHHQKGCFLRFSNDSSEEVKEIFENDTYIVLIKPECKEQVFKELFNLGISYENIYPDIDNLVKTIKYFN